MRLHHAVLLSVLFFAQTLQAEAPKPRIGVSVPLTGPGVTYGTDQKNMFLLANEKLAGGKYELIFEDDRCDGRAATTVAHRFVDILRIKHILGFPCSGALLSSAAIYTKAGATVVAAGASATEITGIGVFRTWPSDALVAEVLAHYVASKHKSLAIFSEQTDYALSLERGFSTIFKGKIISESFFSDSLDFRSSLVKLRQSGAEALFINTQTEATGINVIKQLRQMGWKPQLYMAYWGASATFREQAQEAAEGMIFAGLPAIDNVATDEGAKLYAQYVERFGPPLSIDIHVLVAYEAFRALHLAIESGKDPKMFLQTAQFDGLFGKWHFDQNGDIQGLRPILKIIREGKPVPYTAHH